MQVLHLEEENAETTQISQHSQKKGVHQFKAGLPHVV
jgi:hypothetical protein